MTNAIASRRAADPARTQLLQVVRQTYLADEAFQGCPVGDLPAQLGLSMDSLREQLRAAVEAGELALVFGDLHPNPLVRALPDEPPGEQLRKLKAAPLELACAYPTAPQLAEQVDAKAFAGRPFAMQLALGMPQLAYESFSLEVLERYRSDARCRIQASDIVGTVWVQDKALIKAFGFSNDAEGNRAVAVFLCYLAKLPAEHQAHWLAHRLQGEFSLNPDFYRTQINGDWPERVSIFDALLEEMQHINHMARLMGREPFFRRVPRGPERPEALRFLLRPTQRQLRAFLVQLDDLLIENLEPGFFGQDLPQLCRLLQVEADASLSGAQRLRLLDAWLTHRFRASDPQPMQEALQALRDLQSARYRPAGDLDDAHFDAAVTQEQRNWMKRLYTAVRVFRLIFENHPAVGEYQVSRYLHEGLIWTR